jgi:hypothetical protein
MNNDKSIEEYRKYLMKKYGFIFDSEYNETFEKLINGFIERKKKKNN